MTTTRLLRHVNSQKCLRLLRDRGPQSKADLARELGVTKTTVGYAVGELMDAGLVVEVGIEQGGSYRGRPGNALTLNSNGAYFVGVEVTPEHLLVVLCDFSLAIVKRVTIPLKISETPADNVVPRIRSIVDTMLRESRLSETDVYGLGMSVSGIVTPAGRVFIPPVRLWNEVDLTVMLTAAMPRGWVIKCCNDAAATAFLISERLPEREKESLLVLVLANGIGSAVVRNGIVDRGAHGVAGEIGLMRLSDALSNSANTFQDGAGYAHFAKFIGTAEDPEDAVNALAAMGETDAELLETLSVWSDRLAAAFLNAIYLLDPALIVVSGPLSVLYPKVAERVAERLQEKFIPGLSVPPIVVDGPGQRLPAVGAAALIREDLFLLPAFSSVAA
ncbi:ROK family transcriptional regulator [Rhizobium sp. 2MFCol3.1]|uniref:ROK family protein n=1 Tax=Rhizobium sp. 2MFCol3.1 TaxID=1246459 RepID=UPI0003757130|nr:ROK family transcriptional regulator [Rhizobium sp. 2MFCol3.1]